MVAVISVWRWVVSQDKALANARAAAVGCSRQRLERAEVEAYLEARLGRPVAAPTSWTAREATSRAR